MLRKGERAGFVCTNSIAQNESREASIDKVIAKGGTLVDAWKSLVWPDDAAVHVSVVNWIMDDYDGVKTLEGKEVTAISPGLTGSIDVTRAASLFWNKGLCFMGVTPGNSGFVLSSEERDAIVAADEHSAEVIKPFLIGMDVNREIDQKPTRWIIDFGAMETEEAEGYMGAMRHVRKHVYTTKKSRSDRKTEAEKQRWWQFARPRGDLREAIEGHSNVLVIPRVSPHLIVCRRPNTSCFDGQLMVVALDCYYHFGLLQSAVHEAWVLAQCSTLEERIRYTNTTCFETFSFPPPPHGKYTPSMVPVGSKLEGLARAFSDERARIGVDRQLGLTKVHNLLVEGELPSLTAAYDAMNDAVCEGYGWPEGTWRDREKTLELLIARNRMVANES